MRVQYQSQVFYPLSRQWMVCGGIMVNFSDAIRRCWIEQQLWRGHSPKSAPPECRVAIVNGLNVVSYAAVPWDEDFNNPAIHDDTIVVHNWRCAEQAFQSSMGRKANTMYDEMIAQQR